MIADSTDYQVKYTTSTGDGSWTYPATISSVSSKDGAAETIFHDKISAALTSSSKDHPQWVYYGTYDHEAGWDFHSINAKYRAEGRPSVTVLGDRFYIVYRGTNNGVYLIYTTNGKDWTDVGRIGSKYAETHQGPAIAAFGEKLLLAGVGADEHVYYTITNKDGKREQSWTKLESSNPDTYGALTLTPVLSEDDDEDEEKKLYLLRGIKVNHAYGFHTFTATKDGHKWSGVQPAWASLTGAAGTPWKNKTVCTVFQNTSNQLFSQTIFPTGFAFPPGLIPRTEDSTPRGEVGVANLDGVLVVTFSEEAYEESTSKLPAYTAVPIMDEKRALAERDSQWNCKWQEEENKTNSIASFIKGCFCG